MKPLDLVRRLLACGALGVALASQAAPFSESGDAGDTLAGANDASGVTALSQITGALSNEAATLDRIDIFRISVPFPANFSATTTNDFSILLADPVLFLFDAAGVAVAMDDESAGGGQAHVTLPAGSLAGDYYLAIAFAGLEPLDTNGNAMFDAFGSLAVFSALPLGSWAGDPFALDPAIIGLYDILIVSVPEIGTLLLAGLGIGIIPALRKSRRRSA